MDMAKIVKFLDQKGWLVEDWRGTGVHHADGALMLHDARTRLVRQDLTKYTSSVQALVLNPLPGVTGWQDVLGNALKSAHEALVVVVPLPFSDPYGPRVVDGVLQFSHRELLVWFEHWDVKEERDASVVVFYLSKR